MFRIVQNSPPFYVICHSKTPFKCIEDAITNQITQSFVLRGLWLRHDGNCRWKKTVYMKKSTLKSLFFCGKYVFPSHNSYNIPQTIIFNISMLVHVFFQTPHIIHMTKSQSMSRIVQNSPPFYVICHSKTPFKCIEDPITNQITQSFVQRSLWLRHDGNCRLKKDCIYEKIYSKITVFLRKVCVSIPQ